MKYLKALLLVGLLSVTSQAFGQQTMKLMSLAANTVSNILSSSAVIDNFVLINATTNNATLKFYDSSTTTTTMVQQAYSSYASYATNYSIVFTNSAAVLVTNTFSGIYTAPTANAKSTNSLPVLNPVLIIPAGSVLNKDVRMLVIKGLSAISDQALSGTVTYRNP